MAENAAAVYTTGEAFRTGEELSALAGPSVGILQLNDDCLQEIFGLLDLGDQLRLSMTCFRLTAAFQSYCRRHRRVLHKDDLNNLTLKQLRHLFKFVGWYIEELIQLPYKACERNHYVTLVNEHCPNVKRISFEATKIKSKCLRKLLANTKEVTELLLSNCSLDDKAMLGVAELLKLEILNLRRNAAISGKHLWKLTNLRELNLLDCDIVEGRFLEMCKSLKQLKKLNICFCRQLTHEAYRAIPMYCKQLEQLLCTGELRADVISCLKGLKLLCYEYRYQIEPDCLRQIANMVNLETISLAGSYLVENAELLLVVRNCTKLKYVNIMFCEHIDDVFVYDAIAELEGQLKSKRRVPESVPVLFLVSKTRVTQDILESSRYMAATALIRLSFVNAFQYNYMRHSYLTGADPEYADLNPFR